MMKTRHLPLVLALALFPCVSDAQEPNVEDNAPADSTQTEHAPTDLDRARETLQQLDELEATIRRLESERPEDEADRQLWRVDVIKLLDNLDGLTAKLVKTIAKLDTTVPSTDSVKNAAKEHLEFQADLYARAFDMLGDNLSEMRAQRQDLPATDLADLETRIAYEREIIDDLLTRAVDTGARMEAIGLDATDAWRSLDQILRERAESLAGRLQVAVLERERIQKQLRDARGTGSAEEGLADLRARLLANEPRIHGIASSLNKIAGLLDRRGISSVEYRQMVIRATGEVTKDLLNPRVLLGLAKVLLESSWVWLKDRGPTYLTWLLIVVLFALLFNVLFRLTWRMLLLTRLTKPSKLLQDMVGRLLRPFATLAGIVAGLWFLGVDPTALLTGVGVAGIIVGLALQDSLSNLAAGAFILAYRPYDVDDSVIVGGVLGTVKAMGLANTTIHTFDNRRLSVPNRKVWQEVIENRSSQRVRRVETSIRISYRDDIDGAIRIIREMLDKNEMVLSKPEPSIYVSNLADSWIEIAVWPWTKVDDWWTLTMELPRHLWYCLQEAGIRVPYPRREIDLSSSPGLGPLPGNESCEP